MINPQKPLKLFGKYYHVVTILVLLVMSATFYSLSFNIERLSWLAFTALAPFFLALARTKSLRGAGICGGLFGFFLSHGTGYFVYYALTAHFNKPFLVSVLFFIVCIALPVSILYAFLGVLFRLLYSKNLIFFSVVVPCIWVVTEYFKEVFPFLVPWGNLVYALPQSGFNFIQTADIFGCYGVLFLIATINGVLTFLITDNLKRPGLIKIIYPLIIIILLFSASNFYGTYKTDRIRKSTEKTHGFKVTIVQGNYSNLERWSATGFLSRIKRYLLLSAMTNSSLIVWPETVINDPEKTNIDLFNLITKSIGQKRVLIAGGVRKTEKTYNSAFVVSKKDKTIVDSYDKNILLPWVETGLLPLGFYSAPKAFDKGRSSPVRNTPLGTAGISICFEILYPEYAMHMVKAGSRFLVNISNDTWFGNTPMPRLHLNAAVLRAIETRRPVVRASNSGISAVISPTGEILKKTALFKQEKLTANVNPSDKITLFTRYGNCAVWLSFFVVLTALITTIRKR